MPGKLRARGFVPPQIDIDWVRDGLAALGSICEWPQCSFPAVVAHEGSTSIAYLCTTHAPMAARTHNHTVWLDGEMWEWFRNLYDLILQIEKSGGKLIELVAERDAQIEHERERLTRTTRQLERQAVGIVRKAINEGRVGVPDDELIEARGAQSPPRTGDQFVFRTPEPLPPSPVVLPKFARPDLLLLVELM